MKLILAALLVTPMFSNVALANLNYTTEFYEKGSDKKNLIFTCRSEIEKSAEGAVTTNTFRNKKGEVSAVEILTTDKNGRIISYRGSQKEQGTEGEVKLQNGKAIFTEFLEGGKTKIDEENVDAGEFTAGPAIPEEIRANWDRFMNGEKIKRRVAVLDRRETIGFEFQKQADAEVQGQKVTVIRMKPSNFLIAQVVDPMFFYFNDDRQMIELKGRTQLKTLVGKKWEDTDAVGVFTYPSGGNSK